MLHLTEGHQKFSLFRKQASFPSILSQRGQQTSLPRQTSVTVDCFIFFHLADCPLRETNLSDFQIVCLRLSRVNHACIPNSAHWYDDDSRVKILFSEKPIKAGEEITYSYVTLRSLQHNYTPAIIRTSLQLTWGIFCPEGLFWFLTK